MNINRRCFIRRASGLLVPIGFPNIIRAASVHRGPLPQAAGGGNTVTIDTSSKTASPSSVTGANTISITVASNSDCVLFVGCAGGDNTIGDRTVDSVSSNVSGAFTHVAADADNANFTRAEWWYLANPTAGINVITIVWNTAGNTDCAWAAAISLYHVNTSAPVGTFQQDNATATASGSATVTIGSGGMALGVVCSDADSMLTFTTGTEQQKTTGIASDLCAGMATNSASGQIAFTGSTPDTGFSLSVIPVASAP